MATFTSGGTKDTAMPPPGRPAVISSENRTPRCETVVNRHDEADRTRIICPGGHCCCALHHIGCSRQNDCAHLPADVGEVSQGLGALINIGLNEMQIAPIEGLSSTSRPTSHRQQRSISRMDAVGTVYEEANEVTTIQPGSEFDVKWKIEAPHPGYMKLSILKRVRTRKWWQHLDHYQGYHCSYTASSEPRMWQQRTDYAFVEHYAFVGRVAGGSSDQSTPSSNTTPSANTTPTASNSYNGGSEATTAPSPATAPSTSTTDSSVAGDSDTSKCARRMPVTRLDRACE
ncbi:Chitin-binding, domain 3 [Phytophthora cactorum]|nr:Chitin-binding, domain 3 [Phytophthora cactorum]